MSNQFEKKLMISSKDMEIKVVSWNRISLFQNSKYKTVSVTMMALNIFDGNFRASFFRMVTEILQRYLD